MPYLLLSLFLLLLIIAIKITFSLILLTRTMIAAIYLQLYLKSYNNVYCHYILNVRIAQFEKILFL